MSEVWRIVADAPDYAVSSLGRVRRETDGHITEAGRIVAPSWAAGGYHRVTLRLADGRRQVRTVHKLVCVAFHGPPPFKGAQVAHRDGTRTNNREGNLSWKTAKGNAADRQLHGRTVRGEKHHLTHLDADAVRAIRQSPLSCRDCGVQFGVSKATVSRIRRKIWWGHIAD